MGNSLDVQEAAHQGQRIERDYKAPPVPLDGLREELLQMTKHSPWSHDLDHTPIRKLRGKEKAKK